MSNTNNVDINFSWAAIAILVVFCWGEPDIIDGIVYTLTGVKSW